MGGLRSFDNRGRLEVDISLDLPVGIMLPTAIAAADLPDGWLECDGSAVTAAAYPDLRAFLIAAGSQFGTSGPDPLLPDTRGRHVVGKGTHVDVDTIGKTDGLAVASRTPNHLHNVPGHGHTVSAHDHPYASHQHGSPSHGHTEETHLHAAANHNHNVSGSTAGASGGTYDDDFGVAGVNRICFLAHLHANGPLTGDFTTPANTGYDSGGGTGGPVGQVNGGLTGGSATTVVGSNSDAVTSNGASNSSTSPMPYTTGRFMIKAVA